MKSPFPASYSTLSATALADFISERYALGAIACTLLTRGVGDTYLVQSARFRFVFRVYRSSHRSMEAIQEEVRLLLTLKHAQVSVSYPIPDNNGVFLQRFEAIEGERHGVLFSYARGQSMKVLSETQLRNFGREMARFHTVSATIEQGAGRWVFDFETTLFRPLQQLATALSYEPKDHAWLTAAAKHVKDRLTKEATSGFSTGYCHFDFLPKNVHFEGDVVTFFDFDFAGYGWLVNDIMSFWQHLVLDVYTGRMTQAAADEAYAIFLEGYRSCRSVKDDELAAVPYLALGFWLFYMGFHPTHDQFFAYSQPAQVKAYTTLLKHIVAKYWDGALTDPPGQLLAN